MRSPSPWANCLALVFGVACASATRADLATAAQVAAKARVDLRCPAPSPAPRPAGAAVDDILGARPGMSYDDAVRIILCTDPQLVKKDDNSRGVRFDARGVKLRLAFEALPAEREKTGKEIMDEMQGRSRDRAAHRRAADLEPGQSRWFVTTAGAPGEEKVLHLARRERFTSDKAPTVALLERALIEKYGPPTQQRRTPQSNASFGSSASLAWVYKSEGRLASERELGSLARCNLAGSSPDSPIRFVRGCGVVVAARVIAQPSNPGIAEYLEVAAVNQDQAVSQIEQTRTSLEASTSQRLGRELDEAQRRADKPRL